MFKKDGVFETSILIAHVCKKILIAPLFFCQTNLTTNLAAQLSEYNILKDLSAFKKFYLNL